MCGHFWTACTTSSSVLCPYFLSQRPSVSFQSSSYNSCRDCSKTWCKFVDLFFLSFSTVNKCDERKKHVGHKHILSATPDVRPVTTAFREFVRDYWLRSYPAATAPALWREDINAGRIFFGHLVCLINDTNQLSQYFASRTYAKFPEVESERTTTSPTLRDGSCSLNSKNYFSDVIFNYFHSVSRKVPRITEKYRLPKADVLTPVNLTPNDSWCTTFDFFVALSARRFIVGAGPN